MKIYQRKTLVSLVAGAFVALAGTAAVAAPISATNTRPTTPVTAGDGPGMQSILDTIFGCTGCVDPISGQSSAAEWAILGSFPTVTPVMQFEIAGYAGSNAMGMWTGTDSTAVTTHQIFSGTAVPGTAAQLQWLTNTSGVITGGAGVNVGSFSGINRYAFGFYLKGPGGTFYSADSLNGGDAQMMAYHNTAQNRWAMGFEDVALGDADRDYNDMVFSVESVIAAVPEPETYAMLLAGLGLMGFVARRRQRKLAAA
jgi:hypothetical protein